jgi:signal transduction histidine kinase/ActR/RegA family two-component response regulator
MKRLLTRLLLVMSVAMLPALGFQIYTEHEARRIRAQLVKDEAISLVRLVSDEQNRIIEGAEQVLNAIAGSPAVQDGDIERCHRLLANLVEQSPRYNNAIIAGPDGRIPCASNQTDLRVNIADRPYFLAALQTGDFAIGEYVIGRGSGLPAIHIAKRITNPDGKIIGVAVLALSIGWLAEQVERLSLPPGTIVTITDRNGTILIRRPGQARFSGTQAAASSRFALDGTGVGFAELKSLDQGRPVIVAFAPLAAGPKGLSIRVALDREITFASLARANWIGPGLIFLGIVLALATAAILGARLIGRPISRLVVAAESWRGGDLGSRTGLGGERSEFGRLGNALDGMAVALEERETELRRLNTDLEKRVSEEVAAREAAQARATHSERMQALGQLAGGVAHDFNNVLQAVEGAVLLIERESKGRERTNRLVRLALEATARGASVTRRLLAFGRRGDLRAEAVDTDALLAGLRELLSHTLGAGTEVSVIAEPGLPHILADKAQLEIALVNLATNARDAMPNGGALSLRAAAEAIEARGQANPAGLAPGRYVRLTVADTGTGMDAATLVHVGEPFFTTKKMGEGTGLGVAMVKGFAAQSGGGVHIDSTPGLGTVVTLWLPEAVAGSIPSSAPPALAPEPVRPAAAAIRLLLVDDEKLVRDVLAEQLKDEGMSILTASNGAEALALLDAGEAVDLLVSDFSMPGMDGLALIHAAQERQPNLPAVLLTGYSGDGVALALGSNVTGKIVLLRKPIRAEDLMDRVHVLLTAGESVG